MLDFPWGKRPTAKPKAGDHGTVTFYGGIGYRPARILEVSPLGTRIRLGLLDVSLQSADDVLRQGDSAWVHYGAETLHQRPVRSSIVLPWDGSRYYRVGLASFKINSPQYLGQLI